ncbi:hypothetical protein [Streptomyces sp. R35]|uniref:GNAT family N-acetyltransferase n=1 Tax=Streptomyces sp. R35 TaxID=3238630 RepID=A0AB39SQV5_9ACTN
MTAVDTEILVDVWQRLLTDPRKSWVLFEQSEIAVGLFGRSKRHRDGTELHVVHVEDKRGSADRA